MEVWVEVQRSLSLWTTPIDYTDDIVVKVGGKPINFKLPSLAMGG